MYYRTFNVTLIYLWIIKNKSNLLNGRKGVWRFCEEMILHVRYVAVQDKTLHVHHTAYENGKKIWEYGDEQLITLCEECHEYEHLLDESIAGILWNIRRRGVLSHEISALLETIDIGLFRGNQNAIKDIVGDGFMPDIDRGYIKLLAERRSLIKRKKETSKTS